MSQNGLDLDFLRLSTNLLAIHILLNDRIVLISFEGHQVLEIVGYPDGLTLGVLEDPEILRCILHFHLDLPEFSEELLEAQVVQVLRDEI